MLKKEKIPHEVLNAKHHEREAEIIAQAGQLGKVTIATNMAGRGTDIKLGAGRRRGRWSSYSRERPVMSPDVSTTSCVVVPVVRAIPVRRGFSCRWRMICCVSSDPDRISGIMDKLGMEEDEPIEHTMISRAIENAQRKVEGHHFDIRKHLLEYDDVMNKQREVIYRQRREVLEGDNLRQVLQDMTEDLVDSIVDEVAQERIDAKDWDWDYCRRQIFEIFGQKPGWDDEVRSSFNSETLREAIMDIAEQARQAQEDINGAENQRQIERIILLQIVDSHWKEHLLNMDHLKEGIGLRGYGQKNPLNEYKKEAFDLFMTMIETVKQQTIKTLMRVRLVQEDEVERMEEERRRRQQQELQMNKGAAGAEAKGREPVKRDGDKIGRNAPCPCGSGKKYKKCCGKLN